MRRNFGIFHELYPLFLDKTGKIRYNSKCGRLTRRDVLKNSKLSLGVKKLPLCPEGGVFRMITNKYETIFVMSTKTLDDAAIEATIEKFKKLITDNGGTIESVDAWGKRRLAYAINYETEGYYVLINFESQSALPIELDRVYHITDGILRSIIIKK